ncbi:MAG: hypothetical protein GY883_12405, partial [Shimia sp.]|nr:hypothetical protein [Shimia sp.]
PVADPKDTAPSHDTETEQPTPQSEESVPPEAPAEQPDLPPEPPVAFSSRRQSTANADAPKLGGARRDADPSALDGGQTAPRLNAELRFDLARVVAGLKADVTAPDIPDGDTGRSKKKKSGSFFAARRANNEADRSEPSVPTNAPAQADDSPETTLVTAPPGDVTAERNDRKKEKDQEKARMTVFGSRQSEVRGKPRYLGLVLTTLLLVFLALVALWATYFVEDGVAGLFGTDDDVIVLEQQASHPATPELRETEPLASEAAPTAVETAEPLISEEPELEIAAIDPDDLSTETLPPTSTDTITDSAEIEALLDAEGPLTLTESEANAHYAVTGIWQKAPEAPLDIESASSEEIYLPSIDVSIRALDAFALQSEQALATDLTPKAQNNPPPLGATFAFDERGLVVATPEGTMTPDGVLVFAGRPPLEPASYPKRINVAQALAEAADSRLADVRPRLRPSNLVENNQRATLGGLTLNELATIRPKLRPENVKTAEETNTAPTALAVTTSVRPRAKPANIAQLAQRATASVTEVAAVPAAASITPSIPTTASVARQATIQNAINLKKINLIGVYGTASNRRALVRLSSGRYKKVQVGDRIDGGKVAAIGEGELRYIKSGKNITLKMPKG